MSEPTDATISGHMIGMTDGQNGESRQYTDSFEADATEGFKKLVGIMAECGLNQDFINVMQLYGKSYISGATQYRMDSIEAKIANPTSPAYMAERVASTKPGYYESLRNHMGLRDHVLGEAQKMIDEMAAPYDDFQNDPLGSYLRGHELFNRQHEALAMGLYFVSNTAEDDIRPLFCAQLTPADLAAINGDSVDFMQMTHGLSDTFGDNFDMEQLPTNHDDTDPRALTIRALVQRSQAMSMIGQVLEFAPTYTTPMNYIEELASIQYGSSVTQAVERRSYLDSRRLKDYQKLLRDIQQPPSNGAKKPQPIHQAIPKDRGEDMLRLILAIDENMTSVNARDVKPETIARRIKRYTDEEARILSIRDKIKDIFDKSDESIDDKPVVYQILALSHRPLVDIVDDLVNNYEKTNHGNGIKSTVREYLGRDVADRVSRVVSSLRQNK